MLNTQERALLAASAKAKQAQVGWTMVDDAVTGARLGIPTKQVPNKSQSKTGTRWSSAQGQVQVETFRIREPGTTLAAVYEQQKKEPSTRKLEVNLLRPDFFILSGMQNLKKFYVRAEIKDGEVRGMTVLYDQATETIMDPVAVVMSSAFTPFPGVAGVAQIGPAPKRKVEYGTGIVVSAAGHILTDRQVTDGCNVIVVGGYGDADRQAEDKTADLALLARLRRARSRARGVCRRRPEGSRPHARSASPTRKAKAAAARSRRWPRSSRATRWSRRRSSAFPAAPRSTARAASSAWSSSRPPSSPMSARPARSRRRPWCRRRRSARSSRPKARARDRGPRRPRCRQGLGGAGDLRAEVSCGLAAP